MIRPSTEAELAIIRSAWCKSFNPSSGHGDLKDGLMHWGRNRGVSPALARRMFSAMVQQATSVDSVLVFDVDGVPLATICRELINDDSGSPRFVALHFVYTVFQAQRKKLATELVKFVQGEALALEIPVKPTMMTPNGRALKRAIDGT